MKLVINIPDEIAGNLVDCVCLATNRPEGSEVTKEDWTKDQTIRALKNLAGSGAARQAMTAQRAALAANDLS